MYCNNSLRELKTMFTQCLLYIALATAISPQINLLLHFLEEHLQFVFKYIDPKDEERPFVFTVAITNHDKYNGNANIAFMFMLYHLAGVLIGAAEFNAGGWGVTLQWTRLHSIQGGVELLLVASCYRKQRYM